MRSIPVKKSVNQLIFAAGVLAVWEALALAKVWPPYLFPTPQGVAQSLYDGFKDHSLWIGIGVSLRRVVIGYAISVVLGILLGMVLASNKFLEDTLGRVILSLQSLPSACWVPIALLWFGLSETAIIFVTITGSLLAVTQSTKAGFDNVPRILSMAGRNLGAKGPQMFWHVLLPASLPKGLLIAHKTGTLHDTLNDVGIVELDGAPYVICVLTTRVSPCFTKYRTPWSVSRYMIRLPARAWARVVSNSDWFNWKPERRTSRSSSTFLPAMRRICLFDKRSSSQTERPATSPAGSNSCVSSFDMTSPETGR